MSGQYQGAEESQDTALKSHDDFVHAITEMATLRGLRSAGALGAEQASLAVASMRYSDRAVALSPVDRTELFEFQGLRHVAAADPRGALDAFELARDAAVDDSQKITTL